jgi:hypothetical protein
MGGVTGVKIMHVDEGSVWMCDQIRSAKGGWAIGKIGTSEFEAICFYRQRQIIPETYPNKIRLQMSVNAGLWAGENQTLDEAIDEWAKAAIAAISTFDGIVAWNPMFPQKEDIFLREFAPKIPRVVLRCLEPYYSPNNQYTLEMNTGSIAVVTPFADTITKQWLKRTLLFPNGGAAGQMWLESQNLIAIKAPFGPTMTPKALSLSWSDEILKAGALAGVEDLANQVSQSGARYAFVGIGCLSVLLVAELKKRGIVAIHTGGGTQIMFGVKGERWKYHNVISHLFNENWVKPAADERPSNADSVEGACYW